MMAPGYDGTMNFEHGASTEEWQDWHPEKHPPGRADVEGSESVRSELEKYLLQTPKEYDLGFRDVTSEKRLLGSKNQVNFINLKDDGSAIFKPASGEAVNLRPEVSEGTYHKREHAAYLVNKFLSLDLVPPTVVREMDGEVGSAQEFIPDADVAINAKIDKEDQQLKENLIKMWLFDYIIWNSDRHGGNVLLKESKVFAIDNGLSFGADPLRTFKGFYGLEIPDTIKQIFINATAAQQLLEVLQDLLTELIPPREAQLCIQRINYLAVYFDTDDMIIENFDLPYDPADEYDMRIADTHPTHDSEWHKRTFDRNSQLEPSTEKLLDMEASSSFDSAAGYESTDSLLELIREMEKV
jgi:hypothetical protein